FQRYWPRSAACRPKRANQPARQLTAAMSFLRPLIAGPADLRVSGGMLPSEASSAETDPFLPSAATRAASRAPSSAADAIAAERSARSVSIWVSSVDIGKLPVVGREAVSGGSARPWVTNEKAP